MKMHSAILPAFLVLVLTMVISLVTGHPEGLFLSRSTIGILIRFVIATPVLVVPIAVLPRLLTVTADFAKRGRTGWLLGQFVMTRAHPHHGFTVSYDLVLRPLQGIALSMIFAERFLAFLEFSTGTSYAAIVVRSTVFAFLMLNPLISLFLSFMWTFDDLGVRLYNRKTSEARMLGSSIGIALPLISGVIGLFTLFHRTYFVDALTDLIGGFMVLYPPYVTFVILHHEYVRRHFSFLLERLPFRTLETKVTRTILPQ